MRHFVHYHNPNVMGYDAIEGKGLNVVTDKPGEEAIGQRVWLLTGRGKPREYFLCLTFIADAVGAAPEGQFRTLISGADGKIFQPFPEVGDLPWFPALKRATGNFAFGLQPVADPEIIQGLEAIAAERGH